ncbi:MAG: hypothetical protein J4452_02580 [Candidatus Aenigmarchaeota archaeon]|nr:hypothetical protein [Candidatus Aenigmarchaeota archaeon]
MVDIPTGYFFLTVSGSGILAIGTVVLLARLFGFRFTTQQVGAINKPADSPEHISLFQRELLKLGDEKMHYIPQAELKVPYGLGDRASALVHRFHGYVLTERKTQNGQYTLLDASIPPTQWDEFKRELKRAEYVLDAYSHFGKTIGEKLK